MTIEISMAITDAEISDNERMNEQKITGIKLVGIGRECVAF